LPASLQLALYKLGDPAEEIRNAAGKLLHSICKIHFNQVYYPLEINTQTYATYQQSQVLVSSSLARDHAGITLDFYEECLTRLRMVDMLARDRLLRYLNPWMRNITLTSSSTGILDKLVVVTLKFGSIFINTVRNLWLTLSSHGTNLKEILKYLIHKSGNLQQKFAYQPILISFVQWRRRI